MALQVSSGVGRIALQGPTAGNRIDDEVAAALRDAASAALEDDSVAVVLLTARGGDFCLGSAPLPANTPFADALASRGVAEAIAGIPKPVIVALQGRVTGQGLEIALAADIRLAASDAMLSMRQSQDGVMPWDGGTQRLPRLLPRGIAIEMLLAARVLTAVEAENWGLVSQVVPGQQLKATAEALAGKLATMAPIAASYAKEAILRGMDLPIEQGIRLEADLAVLLHSTKDRAEGIRSFLEKRPPKFTGQ